MIVSKLQGELPNIAHYPELQEQQGLWKLMSQCWKVEPSERPGIEEVLRVAYDESRLLPIP